MDSLADLEFNAILDLGCGSGILAFAAEKLWPKAKVLACDIEEVAVDIANQNAITNGSKILFYQNNEEQIISPPHDQMRFDLIVSNILASPLISLSQEISKYITPDGYLILSGFLEFQLEEVQRVYESLQFEIVNTITKNKWVILVVKVKRY
jgi:ribosomal protein L11 methyltransferase